MHDLRYDMSIHFSWIRSNYDAH